MEGCWAIVLVSGKHGTASAASLEIHDKEKIFF